MRTILIVWFILGLEHQPMHGTRVALVFLERLSKKTAAIIGYEFNSFTNPDAFYDVHSARASASSTSSTRSH